jgi:hypothetical protein
MSEVAEPGSGCCGSPRVSRRCHTVSVEARAIVFGLEQLSTTTKHTFIIALSRLHRPTTLCEFDLMKRKRSEGHDQAPHDSTTQKRLESRYAEFPITGEASLLSTKRTPPAPCCQYCAERCSRASDSSPPSPQRKRGALSLNPQTPPKRLRRSTSQPLQRESRRASCLEHDHSTPRLPLTEENLRALVPITSITEKASSLSAPLNPPPTPAP